MNAKDKSKNSPMDWAAFEGHAEVIEALLQAGGYLIIFTYFLFCWAARLICLGYSYMYQVQAALLKGIHHEIRLAFVLVCSSRHFLVAVLHM